MSESLRTVVINSSGLVSIPIGQPVAGNPISRKFSGPVINQNALTTGSVPLTNSFYTQEFTLPSNFSRGAHIPQISGFQVLVDIDVGYSTVATIEYYLQRYDVGAGWAGILTGVQVGAHTDGSKVWFDVIFDPVTVAEGDLISRFRIGIKGRSASQTTFNKPVTYDGTNVIIDGDVIAVIPNIAAGPLQEGQWYPFDYRGVPSVLWVEPGSAAVFYSVQQGVNKIYYTAPNPLNPEPGSRAYNADGVNTVLDVGRTVAFNFRLLATVADEGTDYLGNTFRSVLVTQDPGNVSTQDSDLKNSFWLSKPNPSKFAVESLYFDVRDSDKAAVVIDRILLDPLTPGVWFNVYFSNDETPGTDIPSWETLMWEHVPKTFNALRREEFALPAPITAKYVKLEFCHLQAKAYAAGDFQKPLLYKKHPAWVLDYFLTRYNRQLTFDPLIARSVQLRFDALDMAYNYFLDDLRQAPDSPSSAVDNPTPGALSNLLSTLSVANSVDLTTLNKIRIEFTPFLTQPAAQGRPGTALGDLSALPTLPTDFTNYSVETLNSQIANISDVSSPNRDALIVEKNWPVMYFFVPCRHGYREALAKFDNDVAYFAGIQEIAFTREHYNTKLDQSLYIESAGDNINCERNDFEQVSFKLVTYQPTGDPQQTITS